MLNFYIQQTQRLLQNPGAPISLYSVADITSYVNIARGQLAGEARCVRVRGTVPTVIGQRNYNFSAINLGTPSVTGVQGVIHVRSIQYAVAQGFKELYPRAWPWFEFYSLNNPLPPSGAPFTWSQYGQGSAGLGSITGEGAGLIGSGTFFVDPIPDIIYTLTCDCVCYPIALTADNTFEAIPYLWTDAVPFYAAYYALLSAQTSARMADAERYYGYYTQFVQRARTAATPDVLQYEYEQVADPTGLNQIGMPQGRGQGGSAMTTLFDHLQMTQQFLGDENQKRLNPQDLIQWINRGRRKIASQCQCIRVKSSISGQIVSWAVTNPGSGYTAPVCIITPPDFPSGELPFPNGDQALATATVLGGQITSIQNTYGGYGYFQPVMTIADPTGSGAVVTPTVKILMTLNRGQEVYNFSDVDLSANPGVESVYAVRSVSIIYANYRYSLPMYSFSTYQAMIRQYPFQYQYVPTFCSQYKQGAAGSIYCYPLPSQTYQMEWDMQCLPQNLTDDQSEEVIQRPWDELPPYFAAHLAYARLQNLNASKYYLDLYTKMAQDYSGEARIGRVVNPYGRY